MESSRAFPTSSKEMPSDQATWLFENGATLIIMDMPIGSEFGMDYNTWEIGEQFKGIKMIPPGFHYFYYSAVDKMRQVAPRTGIMRFFKPKEIFVRVWNKSTEDLSEVPEHSELMTSLISNKRDLDRFLGVYPYEGLKRWISFTSHITSESVDRMMPLNGQIYSAPLLESKPSTTQSRLQAQREANAASYRDVVSNVETGLPEMNPVPGSELRFVEIAKRSFAADSSPTKITSLAMDDSCRLEGLFGPVDSRSSVEFILSELQLAYVCFLVGQVFEAFEHWKKLVVLLCGCVRALEKNPELFIKFIGILHYHIREVPEDFFTDIVTRNNFLVSSLTNFFENIQVSDCTPALKSKGDMFRKNLEKRFSWDFDYESGENAPVVVESS